MRVPGNRRTMTLPAVRPGAVVLLLAAGLLAALFAVTAIAPQPAGAQTTLRNIIEVDGGRSSKMVFKVTPPATGYLNPSDRIQITMPEEFDLPSSVDMERIGFSGSGDGRAAPLEATADGAISDKMLTLTIPPDPNTDAASTGDTLDERVGEGEHLVITIERDSGITAPETPVGFDSPNEGYNVAVTFVDTKDTPETTDDTTRSTTDENIIVIKNPLSSDVPSAAVRVTLVTYATAQIGPSQEITVDFSGPSEDSEFIVPPSISNTRVTISYTDSGPGGDLSDSFNPSEILVQGARVTLTVPPGTSANPEGESIPQGEYTITFSQSARIRNPSAAGNREIKISSTAPGDDEVDRITAVIRRTTTIDTDEGPRGTEFILRGKGYPPGTVTVYHDTNNNDRIDAGETLASATTVRGAFNVDLAARGEPGDLEYRVKAKDSEGVDDEVVFRIKSGIFFQPSPARVGAPLKITISDWQDPDEYVAAVSIAGEPAYVADVKEYSNCLDYTGVFKANDDGVVSIEVVAPIYVPPGEQTVALYDYGELENYLVDAEGDYVLDAEGKKTSIIKVACSDPDLSGQKGSMVGSNVVAELKEEPSSPIIKATVEIVEQNLTLTPATAARGQRVTITGTGFTRAARGDDHIESVWIGGERVEDDPSGFEVGTEGSIALTVTVPLDVADGENEVLIEGSDHTLGRATLDIPRASIILDPPQGQRGTEFTVTGSGFVAGEAVLLSYYSGALITSATTELAASGILADSQGGFEFTFQVPVTAEVGLSHLVTAVTRAEDTTATVRAEARHLVTQTDITTTPGSVSPGDHLTISAHRMPPFTLVGPIKIAGIPLNLPSEIATDEDGSFETKVLIPQIDYGDQILLIQVAGVIIPHVIEVAPPPLSGTPGQVFKHLIRDGVLSIVWHYDNATQSWLLFDPWLAEEICLS